VTGYYFGRRRKKWGGRVWLTWPSHVVAITPRLSPPSLSTRA